MKSKLNTKKIAYCGLFAALCYAGTMLNIPFSIAGMKTMIHFGNIFCLISAVVLGPILGGIASSIGMGLFDMLNGYVVYAPSTIILKFFIAFIAGKLYYKAQSKSTKNLVKAFSAGMLFNVIFSPIVIYILAKLLGFGEASSIIATWESLATLFNAIIAVVVATLITKKLIASNIIKD